MRDQYTQVAESVPFDNTSNSFSSDNLQNATEEAVFRIDNVIHVNKQAYPGHYSTIKAALASISDSDSYTIIVGPGVYVEDNSVTPVTLKPGVTLRAAGSSTVIVEPQDATKDLFLIDEPNCRMQGMTIRNVTAATAIKITESVTPAIFDIITVSNCEVCVEVESDQTITQAVFRNLRLISGSTTTHLMKITALDSLDAIARLYSAILTDDNGTSFVTGISLTGTGARLDPNTLLLRSTTGEGIGISVADGAHLELTSGAEIHGFDENLVFPVGGAAPTTQLHGMTLHEGITNDLRISHTTASGSFHGIARRSKIVNSAPSTFLLNYIDPVNANYNNTGMLITRGLSPETTNIVTDGNTHQLTRFSAHATFFTGTTAGTTLKLADATTFAKTGHLYDVWNFSSVDVDIADFDDNVLATIKPNGHTLIVLRDTSSSAGLWGLTYTVDSGTIFGSEVNYEDADAETSNNSTTTWANKITLVTPSLPAGDYLVQYQFNWRSQNADRQLEFRIQRGGTDIDTGEPFTGSTADRQLISGFKRLLSISGVQTFTLDFRVGGSGTTVYMYNARLFVWRIG